jgi:hypothetical protein
MKIQMTHPNLEGRVIEVEKRAVPHYERSGWRVALADTHRPARRRQTSKERD